MNSRQRLAKSAFADSKTGAGRFRPSVARGFNLRAKAADMRDRIQRADAEA